MSVISDLDLQEKDFGPLECTHRGVHAGANFPKADPGAKRESGEDFRRRVKRAGLTGMHEACELAAVDLKQLGLERHSRTDHRSHTDDRELPVVLLVTHGIWISTFLKLFPPAILSAGAMVPFFHPLRATPACFSSMSWRLLGCPQALHLLRAFQSDWCASIGCHTCL